MTKPLIQIHFGVFPDFRFHCVRGDALADVLFGLVNPSARLTVTWPSSDRQSLPSITQWPGVNNVAQYSEQLLIGYRLYSTLNLTPNFWFGHGLSYTSFQYSDFEARVDGRSGVYLSCMVTNTGPLDGSEVVQLYVTFPDSYKQPRIALKACRPGLRLFVMLADSAPLCRAGRVLLSAKERPQRPPFALILNEAI
jgi:hypothetical protein